MIELWFDFSCPYAYLASQRAEALAQQLGTEIAWRPMLLGGVFRGIGAGDGPMANLSAEKARYNLSDMHRWAEVFATQAFGRADSRFAVPASHPMRTVRALRVLLALPEPSWPRAIAALYAAYWQRGEDVTSDAVLASALRTAGYADAVVAGALERADSDAVKAELRRRTDEAIALGIFGAPAWLVRPPGREPVLLWGQDRMAWVAEVWNGWDADTAAPPGGPRLPPHAARDRELHVYHDVGSPFAYLALTQLASVGGRLVLHPIALGALFKDLGTANVPLFDFVPAKRGYILRDMQRWARWWGVPLAMPAKFPQRTLTAQRLALVARARGAAVDVQLGLAAALAAAMWADGRDVSDDAVLADVLASRGLPAEWLAATREPAIKAMLVEETTAARAAGVFGVPAFRVPEAGAALFWGQDRLDLVVRELDRGGRLST
jgi:2-hydroxychromene-2-carboxylate isomerase